MIQRCDQWDSRNLERQLLRFRPKHTVIPKCIELTFSWTTSEIPKFSTDSFTSGTENTQNHHQVQSGISGAASGPV
jgi:hypothetical protein